MAAFNLSALWELLAGEGEVVDMDMALVLLLGLVMGSVEVLAMVEVVEVLAMEVVEVGTFLVCRVQGPAVMEYTGVLLLMKVQSQTCQAWRTCRQERMTTWWSVRGGTRQRQRRGTVEVWDVLRSPSRNVSRSPTSSHGDSAAPWTSRPVTASPGRFTSKSAMMSQHKTVHPRQPPVAPPASRRSSTSAGRCPGEFLDWWLTGFPRDIVRDSTRTLPALGSGWSESSTVPTGLLEVVEVLVEVVEVLVDQL